MCLRQDQITPLQALEPNVFRAADDARQTAGRQAVRGYVDRRKARLAALKALAPTNPSAILAVLDDGIEDPRDIPFSSIRDLSAFMHR